ncbi:DUF5317 domain-containing protein [Guptibacillus hwajinpoensis]|uniref:DUF5317 domain-containing protein n=1 Tax=Guptibacillus hwajinpoensis TaxID=208199 RepID=UPI001CFE2E34|nr:DUF5317 domain-containing protein [Pseudalkalibacillus hwajinpoensis]WLR61348.1 DUF5317 domain-containing protein [Pseudalkalibacillus hwajinpoensis]
MVFDGILLSILVGYLRKGSLKGFAHLSFKAGWIFPLLLLIEIGIFTFQSSYAWLGTLSAPLFMLIYIVGLIFLWLNRKMNIGIMLLFIGVLLNFIVMAINGGRMPVSLEAANILDPAYAESIKNGLYGKHAVLTDSTAFGFLGDIIPITNPYPKDQVISIGDIIMNIGIFIFIQRVMVKSKHPEDLIKSPAPQKGI